MSDEIEYFSVTSFPLPALFNPNPDPHSLKKQFTSPSRSYSIKMPDMPVFDNIGGPMFRQGPVPNFLVRSIIQDKSLQYLKHLRESTGLGRVDVATALDLLKGSALQGEGATLYHDESSFTEALRRVVELNREAVHELFGFFDVDSNGKIDLLELVSGCMVLCHGSEDEKLSAVFEVFDSDGDGCISMDEMFNFMIAVFHVVLTPQIIEDMKKAGAQIETAEDLASATAVECFKNADINEDGKLCKSEFVKWFANSAHAY